MVSVNFQKVEMAQAFAPVMLSGLEMDVVSPAPRAKMGSHAAAMVNVHSRVLRLSASVTPNGLTMTVVSPSVAHRQASLM